MNANSKLGNHFNSNYQYRVVEPQTAKLIDELDVDYVSTFVIVDKEGSIRLNPAPTTTDSIALKMVLSRIDKSDF